MGDIANGVTNTLLPAKKNIQKKKKLSEVSEPIQLKESPKGQNIAL